LRKPLLGAFGAGIVALAVVSVAQAQSTLESGDTVVTELDAGVLVAVDAGGEVRTVAAGIDDPHGVVVLDDGSILVAEPTVGEVIGVFGRFGDEPTTAATLDGVEALAVAPDGTVYATARAQGEVARLDLDDGTAETIAEGLDQPYGIAAIAAGVLVVETGANRVTSIDPETGATNVMAEEEQGMLIGVASIGGSIFVSDFADGEVIAFTFGTREVIAEVDGPSLLATSPADGDQSGADQVDLLVAAYDEDALVRLDVSGEEVDRLEVDGPFGAAALPSTVDLAPATPSTTEVGAVGTTSTSIADRTGGTQEEASGDSGVNRIVVVGVVGLLALAGGVLWLTRRTDRDDDLVATSAGGDPPAQPEYLAAPADLDFTERIAGTCEEEARAVAEAETVLDATERATAEALQHLDTTEAVLQLAISALDEARNEVELSIETVTALQARLGHDERLRGSSDSVRARIVDSEERHRRARQVAAQAEARVAEARRVYDDARHEADRRLSRAAQSEARLEDARARLLACRESAERQAADDARRRADAEVAAATAALEQALTSGIADELPRRDQPADETSVEEPPE
jgi:hypothetical protein